MVRGIFDAPFKDRPLNNRRIPAFAGSRQAPSMSMPLSLGYSMARTGLSMLRNGFVCWHHFSAAQLSGQHPVKSVTSVGASRVVFLRPIAKPRSCATPASQRLNMLCLAEMIGNPVLFSNPLMLSGSTPSNPLARHKSSRAINKGRKSGWRISSHLPGHPS